VPNLHRRFLEIYSTYLDVIAITDRRIRNLLLQVSENLAACKRAPEPPLDVPHHQSDMQDPASIKEEVRACLDTLRSPCDPFESLNSPLPLSSLCSRCFGGDPKPNVGFISLDGNFQHKRFPTGASQGDSASKIRDFRLFISKDPTEEDQTDVVLFYFTLANDQSLSAALDNESHTRCDRNFKAAGEKNASNAVVDSGLMAAVCRCGVPLRLFNIRKTGERASYALQLVQSILSDQDCPPMLIVAYDIGCRFSKYAKVFPLP